MQRKFPETPSTGCWEITKWMLLHCFGNNSDIETVVKFANRKKTQQTVLREFSALVLHRDSLHFFSGIKKAARHQPVLTLFTCLHVPTLMYCVVICVARANSSKDNNGWTHLALLTIAISNSEQSVALNYDLDRTINLLFCVDSNSTYCWLMRKPVLQQRQRKQAPPETQMLYFSIFFTKTGELYIFLAK